MEKGILRGATAVTFEPEEPLTRAMMVTMLYRMSGERVSSEATFKDVDPACWYGRAVTWATQRGIARGYSDGTFRPEENVSREEMVTFFYRYSLSMGKDTSTGGDLGAYPDHETVLPYAKTAFSWAVGTGLIRGDLEGNVVLLNPRAESTRAQATAVIARYLRMEAGAAGVTAENRVCVWEENIPADGGDLGGN